MAKIYLIQQDDGTITASNWKMRERNKKALEIEISEEDYIDYLNGEKEFKITNKQIRLIKSNKKQEVIDQINQQQEDKRIKREKLNELKEKIEKNEITEQEALQEIIKFI